MTGIWCKHKKILLRTIKILLSSMCFFQAVSVTSFHQEKFSVSYFIIITLRFHLIIIIFLLFPFPATRTCMMEEKGQTKKTENEYRIFLSFLNNTRIAQQYGFCGRKDKRDPLYRKWHNRRSNWHITSPLTFHTTVILLLYQVF